MKQSENVHLSRSYEGKNSHRSKKNTGKFEPEDVQNIGAVVESINRCNENVDN